jgi:hypothetical protein
MLYLKGFDYPPELRFLQNPKSDGIAQLFIGPNSESVRDTLPVAEGLRQLKHVPPNQFGIQAPTPT